MSNRVQIDPDICKKLLPIDPEFFIDFFLHEELEFQIPQFHLDIFKLMIDPGVSRLCLAIPRGHAKTTLAKLATVYHFLFSRYSFIVYVSATTTISINACIDIINFMKSDNFKAMYGELRFEIEQEGTGFYKFWLGDKLCILRAFGAGQQVRGINVDNKRPQLAVVDDLEDDKTIATEDLQAALIKWFYGPFIKALASNNKIIHIGNLIKAGQLLGLHLISPVWHSWHLGVIHRGKILWEDKWPLHALRADFLEYKRLGLLNLWFAEMMNMVNPMGRGLIGIDQIKLHPPVMPGQHLYSFITIDPSISKKTTAHKTAIVVHAFNGNHWQIVDYYHGDALDPVDLFSETMTLAYKWQTNVVGIESVAYQAALKPVFEFLCQVNHIENMQFEELKTGGARKVERLKAWCGLVASGDYRIDENDGVIMNQLINFDPKSEHNDDDLIDACAYGPQMLENFIVDIMNVLQHNIPANVRSFYNVSAI